MVIQDAVMENYYQRDQLQFEARKHILADPYPCDDCGDTYNKNDLINHFRQGYKICRNCINEYFLIYKGNN